MENKELTPEEKIKQKRKKRTLLIAGLGCLSLIIVSCIIFSCIALLFMGNFEEKSKKITQEEESTPTEKVEPELEITPEIQTEEEVESVLFLTTTSQIEPLEKILQKKYKDDFWAGTAGGNDNRIMWYYESKDYSGFISFDVIPTQQEKITNSTLSFTIYPEIKGQKFKKARDEAGKLISQWIKYFSGKSLTRSDFAPLYNSTLKQAEKNYKELGMSTGINTSSIKGYEVTFNYDVKGIFEVNLEKSQ